MTYSVPRTSVIAFGVAALFSLSALSAASAGTFSVSAYAGPDAGVGEVRAKRRYRRS